ncbi:MULTISPECIES: sugar phosphate nucleotidyltransferase [unclassified Bacillus (in: firmicutes)]|uniref:sugar phosphate nucleotidyltransferase n=1 Tax=unclassified Bacillus (in: firmicutes) TaxID=185979 RepID=UPI000660BB70|nr:MULTISPECIES: sugar phosphate nucleotidyltransferase [unclassified Bacillus (in: firmicutes)]CAI9389571.1 Glucose-1-phosphate cytidylyltransferase [Bacillus sp. T2.9-1]
MKVVILCGGKGMRMRGLTENLPKALADVNGKPILWHIMKHYSEYGHQDFILPLGYKGEQIKDYFVNLAWKKNDLKIDLEKNQYDILEKTEPWKITCIDTGIDTMTGARIKQLEEFIQDDIFLLTYGDGLSDIDLDALIAFHKEKGKTVTLTGIQKNNQYGVLDIKDGIATSFTEKPILDNLINGGFFVCNKEFFHYLSAQPDCVLEEEPLRKLINKRELAVYLHEGTWISIDTPKDLEDARKIWKQK